jgi:hypothetical protein
MASPVVVSRIQNRRGTQAQFNALYPPGYNGIGGFGNIFVSITTAAAGTGTVATLQLAGGGFTFSGGVDTLGTITPGGSYLPNIYENVPLTGGTGTGARANININGAGSVGAVINDPAVLITNSGIGYTAGDVLSATTQTGVFSTTGLGSGFQVVVSTITNATVLSGSIASFSAIVPNTGPGWTGLNYLPGSYTNVPLIGGHGSGATGTVVVDGATNVSSVVLTNPGTGYLVGDQLSATPLSLGIVVNPPGSGLQAGGFIIPVLTIVAGPPMTAYPIGSTIVVSGVTPLGYNGTFIVTASTPTSVSYLSTATGPQTISGTVASVYDISSYPGVLLPGELALTTDTRRVFIGNINGEYLELSVLV